MMYRRFNASADDETLDSAGRVRLARHLIEHADLSGPCKVIGVGDHIEIWNAERWAEHSAELVRAGPAGSPRSWPRPRAERDGHTHLHGRPSTSQSSPRS